MSLRNGPYSEGTAYLMEHPELWADPVTDIPATLRDFTLYGTAFSKKDENGLLVRVDPTTVEPVP